MATQTEITVEPQTDAGTKMAGLVREAWLATSQLGDEVAPETRETAFKLVLEALLRNGDSQPTSPETGQIASSNGRSEQAVGDDLYSTPELRMDAISSYLEITGEQVEILFNVSESTPQIQIGPGRLSNAKGTATREIALLLLGARTAMGLDTEMDDIRRVVEQYKRYDQGNFAKTLQSSPDLVVLGKPRSSQRTVRLRGVGVSAARELAQRLVS